MNRRTLFKAALGAAAAFTCPNSRSAAQAASHDGLPQPDEPLVFAVGARAGNPVTPGDVQIDGLPVLAYPAGSQRSGTPSRLAQVVLVRFDPALLSAETASRSAEGIVAYSAVCTHTGCEVSELDSGSGSLVCPCHESRFDARDGARVASGPAPRPLASLPLKIVDGTLAAAGPFIGRVGAAEIQ